MFEELVIMLAGFPEGSLSNTLIGCAKSARIYAGRKASETRIPVIRKSKLVQSVREC